MDKKTRGYIITDGHGYLCAIRRPNGKPVTLWSSKKRDAMRLSFYENAERFAELIEQPTKIILV